MGTISSSESTSRSPSIQRHPADYISNNEYAELLQSFEDNIMKCKLNDYELRVFLLVLGELIRKNEFEDRLKAMKDPEMRQIFAQKLVLAKNPMEKASIVTQFQNVTQPNILRVVEIVKFKVPTNEFYEKFSRRCEELKDPDFIFGYLSKSEAALRAEADTLLLQLEDEFQINNYLDKRRAELDGLNKLTVRIIISSLDSSKASGLKIWAASKFTPFGLNHVGLQIGPYYVHWHNGNLVTMHPITAEKSSAVSAIYPIYPFENCMVLRKDLYKLAELMVKYNTEKTYAVGTSDCQCFVEEALTALNIKRRWAKDGPIYQLYTSIRQSKTNNTSVKLKDPAGITHTITNLREMNAFVERVKPQLDKLDKEQRAEFEDCFKCVQRAFQLHGATFEANEANSNRLSEILQGMSSGDMTIEVLDAIKPTCGMK